MAKPEHVAVVLISGGMDSCVTAAIAARDYTVAALHLNYGQRTERRERDAFNEIADYYGTARRLIVNVEHLAAIGGSSLTDTTIEVSSANLSRTDIPTSYVPFRNANFLSIAVSWAEIIGATKIFIGAVEEDSSGYPDCRKSFYDAFNNVIREGTKPETDIEIITPLIDLTKAQIVQRGTELAAPII